MGDKVYLRDLDFSNANCHSIVEVEIFGTGKLIGCLHFTNYAAYRLFGTGKT